MIETPELSIVIPCLNEERTLGETLRLAREAIRLSGLRGEVVVSDNGSTDRSVAIAEEGGARVVTCTQKGYGSALIDGIRGSRGTYIVMGDADATYDFREAVPFVEALKGGADLVMGTRLRGNIDKGAMPFLHRWLGTPVLTFLINRFFGTRISDCNCGMRALAWAGTITQRCGFLTKPAGSWASRSPTTTRPLTWQMRVVRRNMTGVSYCSERTKANFVIS